MFSSNCWVYVLLSLVSSSLEEDIYHSNIARGSGNSRFTLPEWDNVTPQEEADQSFWFNKAQDAVKEKIHRKLNTNLAKNIIFFLGDGMSISTLTSARIHKGQLKGRTGEEATLNFESFPYSGLIKTYCANSQVADSACTSTAYMCGVKTNFFLLGVNAHVNFNNCSASTDPQNRLESIFTWAQRAGKASGLITTNRVTDASPAGGYSHVANRLWESDYDVQYYEEDPATCEDIATQLVMEEPGKNLNVIMGGGREKMLPTTATEGTEETGQRLDGQSLINQWKLNNPNGVYLQNRNELLTKNFSEVSHLLGLFSAGHMDFNLVADRTVQPTLAEMTEAAIRVLEKNNTGYILFVEGARIDHGHHGTSAGIAVDEALEFDKAIGLAMNMTSAEDTLIVITSDHAHTMTIAGYPGRGNDILNINKNDKGSDGVPYLTLNYAFGPKPYRDETGKRIDLTGYISKMSVFPSNVQNDIGAHGGDDVAIIARGPYSHLFSGVLEQNWIPHYMAYAACFGNGPKACDS